MATAATAGTAWTIAPEVADWEAAGADEPAAAPEPETLAVRVAAALPVGTVA